MKVTDTLTKKYNSIQTFRYSHQSQTLPDGWISHPLYAWHGSQGRVIWENTMTNSRAKGAAFERKVANMIQDELGFECKRDIEQYRQADRGDILGVDGWVIECKAYAADRGAGGNYKPDWWAQACKAAHAAGCQPVLIYKYNHQPIKCVVFLSSINPDFVGKDNTATISFATWCMLVREEMA